MARKAQKKIRKDQTHKPYKPQTLPTRTMTRHLIYYSSKARTNGNFTDLMEAGRLDIACHAIIQALFVSHKLRSDVVLHLVFDGPPSPSKHIEIHGNAKLQFVKSDIGKLLKKMLYKGEKGREEIFPGYYIEKKTLVQVAKELQDQGHHIFTLDGKGTDIRELGDEQVTKGVFILGDDDGIPKKLIKYLPGEKCSVGPITYYGSQVIAVLHNEIDRRVEVVELE